MLRRTFLVRNRSHGAAELLSSYAFRCLHHFSTSPFAFPSEEAISASSQVSHLKKSTENYDLIVNLFKQYGGLDQTQITDIISSVPKILSCSLDETLEPRLKIFQQLGLSGSDLVKLVKRDSRLFTTNRGNQMLPNIIYLKKLLGGSDEKVVKAIIRCSWLLASTIKNLAPNLTLLEDYGLSNEVVEKLLIQNPRDILLNPKWLQDVIHRVEGELGIPRDSNMFHYGIIALARVSKPKLEMKFEIFRSFGWADSDIYTMARGQPMCFTLSKDKIRKMLDFYMKELGFKPEYLASHSALLTISLEKRVKPRNHVLTILKENKLVGSDMQLYSVSLVSELKFVQTYVLRFKDKIPNLYETYTNSFKLL